MNPPDDLLGPRLRDGAAGGALRPARGDVAQLLHLASQDATVPSAPAWAAIRNRWEASPPRRMARLLWPGLALASLLLATGATAGQAVWRWLQPPAAMPPPTPPRSEPADFSHPATPPVDEAHAPTESSPVVAKPRLATAAPHTKRAGKSMPPPPSALAEESRLLGEALTALRRDNDPALALRKLERYATRFPSGELAREATNTRLQALLAQKRSGEALALLDDMSFSPRARDTEALVLRGELRARAHRCDEAARDFTAVLARAADGPAAERALFGRASCLLVENQTQAARAALEDYLRRFPTGTYQAQAKRALGR